MNTRNEAIQTEISSTNLYTFSSVSHKWQSQVEINIIPLHIWSHYYIT